MGLGYSLNVLIHGSALSHERADICLGSCQYSLSLDGIEFISGTKKPSRHQPRLGFNLFCHVLKKPINARLFWYWLSAESARAIKLNFSTHVNMKIKDVKPRTIGGVVEFTLMY